jgi:CHRD domain
MTKVRVFFLGTLIALFGAGVAAAIESFNFNSPMDGAQEAPIPRETPAFGNAIYKLNDAGTAIRYKLIVDDIANVIMAHIHQGPSGSSGPIVVWLYPSTEEDVREDPGGGPIEGVIARGTFTAADLVGPLRDQPLSALVALLRNGGAYTNVHTSDGVAPDNQGPGDFPGGEIRGQIKANGPGS